MILIQSVEGQGNSQIRLSKNGVVGLLVCVAVFANTWAFRRVAEIKREIAFSDQLSKGLDDLVTATDQIARHKQAK